MLHVMSKTEVEKWHQEIRDWVEDVINDKYGRFPLNMLSQLMNGFKEMEHELEVYNKKQKAVIKKNRKMLGLPPLE